MGQEMLDNYVRHPRFEMLIFGRAGDRGQGTRSRLEGIEDSIGLGSQPSLT